MRGTLIALVGALMFVCSPAWADAIDTRAEQLRESSEYKVRLSAALWLGKRRDERAVAAMAHALRNDRERTVRSVAALSLGKLVDESLPASVRDTAIDALEHAAKHDTDAKVRDKARAAWVEVKALRSPKGGLPSVFVAVGNPTARDKRLAPATTRAAMQVAIRRTLRRNAPDFGQATQRDGFPSKKQLREARSRGFFVNASVSSIDVVRKGSQVEVRCEVSMRVNPWSGGDGHERIRERETASASGKGRVRGSNTARSIDGARRDCVVAVVESVTEREIIPFVKRAVDGRLARKRND